VSHTILSQPAGKTEAHQSFQGLSGESTQGLSKYVAKAVRAVRAVKAARAVRAVRAVRSITRQQNPGELNCSVEHIFPWFYIETVFMSCLDI
jgi:hypothetical protein